MMCGVRSLARFERNWARAALGAIYPKGASPALPIGIGDLDIEAFLADLLRRIPLTAALGLRVAIWIVALAPVFLMRRLATVARLGPLEQQALVALLLSSSSYAVRQLVMALKATGGLLYGAAESVRAVTRGESTDPLSSADASGERLLPAHALARRAPAKQEEEDVDARVA
jgi:hypothetical protein